MGSKFTHEEVKKFAKWLYGHGFEIYHGNCGSRDIQSDGFFWWSVYLIKDGHDMNEDEIEKNSVVDCVYEVNEQTEEDNYFEHLRYEFEDDLWDIEYFLYNIRLKENRDKLIAYIESNSDY